jgi:hypothetical protein
MTSQEAIMNHFNANSNGCKRRRDCKPQVSYEAGCTSIQCEHADCRCPMNDGDGGPLSDFLAKWEGRHGK